MGTQDSTFFANGSSNPNDFTGVTAWSTPAGNISFDQGMLGIGVMRGLIGLIDTGTKAPAQLPPAVSYTAKVGTFGGANTDTGVAGVSTAGVGIFGQCGNAKGLPDGLSCGVLGASADKPGVIGWSSTNNGVEGESMKHLGSGVLGVSFNGDGVTGSSLADGGVGVTGSANESQGMGVYGEGPLDGSGVRGTSGTGGPQLPKVGYVAGVCGTSDKNAGVMGTSNGYAGIFGFSTNSYGVVGQTANPNSLAGYFLGNLTATGTIAAPVKNAIVPFPDGSKRLLHCMESPEHWFEDFGTGRLKRGRAVVKLDADFANVIKRGDYHVFLTPKGDCHGLCVPRQGGASFEVRELQGGKSSMAFSYRIVGKRKDIKAHRRFAKIDISPPVPPAGRTRRRTQPFLDAMLATLQAGARTPAQDCALAIMTARVTHQAAQASQRRARAGASEVARSSGCSHLPTR